MDMKIKLYQIDAFTDKLFRGNPAAVCILSEWIDDKLMQKIAEENNLSETAFIVRKDKDFEIRWFSPTVEVNLCGHATLAAAHVIFNHCDFGRDEIVFLSKWSGILKVAKEKDYLVLDFPVDTIDETIAPHELTEALKNAPVETYKGNTDYMLVYSSQEDIENLNPDFVLLSKVRAKGIIVTAKGDKVDFVSRFFAPQLGVNEDPVTGSAHTTLTLYWAHKLRKMELTALQLSSRQGWIKCKLSNERVKIAGQAITYMIGEIELNNID